MVNPAFAFIGAQVIPPTISGIADYLRALTEEETKRQAIVANRDVLIARIAAEKTPSSHISANGLLNVALRWMNFSSCFTAPWTARTTTS